MKYGLIGEKLSHSFSKEIHNKIADYEYELKEIAKEKLQEFFLKKDFMAINVTIPYKEAVIPYLYEIDEKAKSIGAVNTVVNKDGRLYGYNTDFDGMTALLKKAGIEVLNKKVLILGTGGTSKTASAVCKALSCREVIKASRTAKDGAFSYDEIYKNHTDCEVIINTTPCGMYPHSEESPIDVEKFKNLEGVIDAIYNPLSTKLVQEAKDKGALSSGGLYMLVAQAVFAYGYFMSKTVDVSVIDEIYSELKSKKQNIVLIGMPGAGKTTIGKLLAEKLGKEYVDSDEEITKKYNKTPAEIINESGEDVFRDTEEAVIEELAKETGKILATGGGAILREQNIKRLKQNGTVIFLDRSIEEIVPTDDRPLSCNTEQLKKRYNERYPIYKSVCDIHIKIENDAEANARKITERIESL